VSRASDPLAALLELIREAAREGAALALNAHAPSEPTEPRAPTLLDKRALAHALGVSTATVDRLCRTNRIPFVRVGDARRFDFVAVRAALDASSAPWPTARLGPTPPLPMSAVKLLTRGGRP
jgi:excisionase family DNA binding protein